MDPYLCFRFGPIVPVVNAEANQLCVYYRFGVLNSQLPNQMQLLLVKLFIMTVKTRLFRYSSCSSDGFYLGRAVSSGTGNPTGTVSVEVSLNDNPPIDSNFESDNITTTGDVSCANVDASGDYL